MCLQVKNITYGKNVNSRFIRCTVEKSAQLISDFWQFREWSVIVIQMKRFWK